MGYAFAFLLMAGGALYNLYLFTIEKVGAFPINLIFIDAGVVVAGLLVMYLINRPMILDLKSGLKSVASLQIEMKEERHTYQVFKGPLGPLLATIFPKFFEPQKPSWIYYILIIGDFHCTVDQDLYNKVKKGDFVTVQYASISGTLLGVEADRL